MVADVSTLTRYIGAAHHSVVEKSTAMITRDLLGGGADRIEAEELDLDLQVPLGWEKRLDLKSGKVYIQRCGLATLPSDQRNQARLQDLNLPPSPSKRTLNLLDEPSLDLKLLSSSSSPSTSYLPFAYQSVCTLDKVKSALERAERESTKRRSPLWRSLQSPSCSTSSSANREICKEQQVKDEKRSSFVSGTPVATGCPSCLAYVLICENNPKCPRCNIMVPVQKKARIDLNISI
ncbi:hypothetical protein SAY87_010717 [Trapa incisa]|uniref:GIR1-like zinc ribbon domain-containing protein n=1 Tax=Trapa incisa TaxID=236973 RepID=A0AAN7GJZ1_9MYRT|nr:hypothetical protein SAY87_010717 [Trapa incisa]